MFYDRIHRFSIQTIWAITLSLGTLGMLRVCEIVFNPKPLSPMRPEDHEDYQKMLNYRRQQEEKEETFS